LVGEAPAVVAASVGAAWLDSVAPPFPGKEGGGARCHCLRWGPAGRSSRRRLTSCAGARGWGLVRGRIVAGRRGESGSFPAHRTSSAAHGVSSVAHGAASADHGVSSANHGASSADHGASSVAREMSTPEHQGFCARKWMDSMEPSAGCGEPAAGWAEREESYASLGVAWARPAVGSARDALGCASHAAGSARSAVGCVTHGRRGGDREASKARGQDFEDPRPPLTPRFSGRSPTSPPP